MSSEVMEVTGEEGVGAQEAEGHARLLASLGVGEAEAGRRAAESVGLEGLLESASRALGEGGKAAGLAAVAAKRAPTLPTPLHRAAAVRTERAAAYASTKADLKKWDGLVRRNRAADQLSFPLYQEPQGLRSVAQARKDGSQPRSRLEKELAAALATSRHHLADDVEYTESEKDILKAMSLKEAERRTAELQRMRALQSYQESKWKRQKKIKSKQYHRLKKRTERRRILKELEELREKDPEAAREKLELLERDRILERGTLSHRGTGQWAKALRLHARHDPATKELLQSQLRYGRELAEKRALQESDSDDDAPKDAQKPADSFERLQQIVGEAGEDDADLPGAFRGKDNPWLRSTLRKLREKTSAQAAPQPNGTADPVHSDELEDEDEDEASPSPPPEESGPPDEPAELPPVQTKKTTKKSAKKAKKEGKKTKTAKKRPLEEEAAEIDGMFEGLEERLVASAKAEASGGRPEQLSDASDDEGGLESLQSRVTKARKQKKAEKKKAAERAAEAASSSKKAAVEKGPEPGEFLSLGARVEGAEELAEEEAAMAEAFADDDVVADFKAEKGRAEEAEKPKALNLALPGWGDWAGPDIKASKSKRRRFTVKAPSKGPRKDRDLPGVIIAERDEEAVRKLQVKSLPFPWTCVEDWEAAQKHPLGKEWNTRLAHKALTQPAVRTQRGRVIRPMDRQATFSQVDDQPHHSGDELK